MNNLLRVLKGRDPAANAPPSKSKSQASISSASTAATPTPSAAVSVNAQDTKERKMVQTPSRAVSYVAKESEPVDLEASTGGWVNFDRMCFCDTEEGSGSLMKNGKLAVQCDPNGNKVVGFRCGEYPLGFDAVTLFRLFAPSKLDNRLSIGVVNDKYSTTSDVEGPDQSFSRMVCNGTTGVGAVVTLDDFAPRTDSKTNDRMPLVIQIDRIQHELVIFQQRLSVDITVTDTDGDSLETGSRTSQEEDDDDSESLGRRRSRRLESMYDDDEVSMGTQKGSSRMFSSLLPGRRKAAGASNNAQGNRKFTPVPPKSRRPGAPVVIKKNDVHRFFDENLDNLVSRVPIPKHWGTIFFAVDLYGKGDEIKISQQVHQYRLVKKKTHKKSKPKHRQPWEQSLSNKERKILEGMFRMAFSTDEQSSDEKSRGFKRLSHRRNKTTSPTAAATEAPRAERATTIGNTTTTGATAEETITNWANGYLPLVSQTMLSMLLSSGSEKSKGKSSKVKQPANVPVVTIDKAYKFQHWAYRMAVAMKPTVMINGSLHSREPMLSSALVKHRSLHRRGVTMRLLRDLPNQCGIFATDESTTLRDVATQLAAWSRPYWRSPAEVLGSLDSYLTNQSSPPDSGSVVVNLEPEAEINAALSASDILPGDQTFDRYVRNEVKKPDYYLSYSWDMPWNVVSSSQLERGLADFNSDMSFWIDIACFNYVSRVINLDAFKTDGDEWVTASTCRVVQLIGNTVLVLDDVGRTLHRLWCLLEVLATLSQGGSLSLCFLGSDDKEVCMFALLAASGRFDGEVKVEASKVNGPRSKVKQQMFSSITSQLGYKNMKEANHSVEQALKASARTFLLRHPRGFTEVEVDSCITRVQKLGVKKFVNPVTGEKDVGRWSKLEKFAFPSF